MPSIAITGATGFVGGHTAARLAERGVAQRLVVRDPGRAPALDGAEVRRAAAYGDHEAMRAALEGVRTLFLVPGHETADRVQQHATAVDAAVAAGVERIVYLSYLDASADSTFTLGRHHAATEDHIRASGVAWTFLRMNLYLDFIPLLAGEDGVIRGPADDGRVSAVLRDDVAAAAAAVLTADCHAGATYDLTGREAFSLAEAAETITRLTGRTVSFQDETIEEAYASRAGFGAPDWQVEAWVSTYTAIAAGELERVSGDVRRLTGRDPLTLEEHLRAGDAGR
jgi:NAD(P)H dehydrogenase (quinone)